MYEIIERRELVPDHHLLTVRAPHVAEHVKPGQFVIVRATEDGERIPLSVADFDREAGTVTNVFLTAGASTMRIAALNAGDQLPTYAGPLGNASPIEKVGSVVLCGGCYGPGAIFPMARAHKEVGNHVTVIVEAHTRWLHYWTDKLRAVADELYVMTSDGSLGERGLSFDKLRALCQAGAKPDLVYSVGCTFQMSQQAKVAEEFDLNLRVALNTIMLDGTGMCGCCRCAVGGETKFACIDGPEFDGRKVDWPALLARRGAYRTQELASLRRDTALPVREGSRGRLLSSAPQPIEEVK